MSDNLELWNKVCQTNPADTKKVDFGRKYTAIDPYKQIRKATEMFGPVGKGWGWQVKEVTELTAIKQIAVLVSVWHGKPDNSIDQFGQAKLFSNKDETMKDNDCMKKAVTDAVTKCLSYLGFNADVFLGLYDDNKYVQEMNQKFAEENKPKGPKKYQPIIDNVFKNPNSKMVEDLRNQLIAEKAPTRAMDYFNKLETEFYHKQNELTLETL